MLGKILLIMGYPASGKTELAKEYESQGYNRLNRDELGGTLDGLVDHLEAIYKEQKITKIVMDNTYPTIRSRRSVIKWAIENKFEIHCKWIDIDIGDALYNASKRMIDRYGKLLTPEEIKESKDISVYPPVVIYKYRKSFEAPKNEEGFNKVEKISFSRKQNDYINKAILLDYDGTIRRTKSGNKYPLYPEDIEILPNRFTILKKYQDDGYHLLGVSNQSIISKGEISVQATRKCFEITHNLLGIQMDYLFCPHQAYPQVCYCRKPLPGMGVVFIEKYKLNPSKCIMIGDMNTDHRFADRCGFQYINAKEFFE